MGRHTTGLAHIWGHPKRGLHSEKKERYIEEHRALQAMVPSHSDGVAILWDDSKRGKCRRDYTESVQG